MAVRPSRILSVCGLLAVVAYWGWNYASGQRELREARKEWMRLQAQKKELTTRLRNLRREVESLEHDAASRSRAARDLLGVVGKNEKVVILPASQ